VYLEGAGRHADALVSRVVHERGLDGSQMTVLFTLWFARPTHRLSPTQLHRMLVQSPSGVTHTVRRLTRSGLTRRVRDSADGRSWYVELTPEGQETAETATKELVNALDAIFGSMGPAQLQTLTDAQRLITETLAASPLAYPTSSRPLAVGDSTDV
jgi:DNA-binding MarR family transcriptional regulator